MYRMKKIGELTPVSSQQIENSRIGIGMEKLDRDAFDPEKVYDKMAALGVKWVRIQSGWQKTEKEKGVYDFTWLDSIVDNLLERKLIPWMCLCYGNILYDDLAKEYYGAVGCPPIRTEEAYSAWIKYTEAVADHFRGRVEYYEVWNEADGIWTWRPAPDAKEYADFCIKTAKAVKKSDKNAKIITGSHFKDSMAFFNTEFQSGVLEVSDAVTYHAYNYDERFTMQKARAIKELSKFYGKEIEVIQGESGSQSETGGNGALGWIRSDQEMQTKQILRHTVADIICDVKFTSIFACVDMAENLDAKEGAPITTCGYFGVLGAEFDKEKGTIIGDYYEKPSYYALQNLCALFHGDFTPVNLPAIFTPTTSRRMDGMDCMAKDIIHGGFRWEDGRVAFAYWNSTNMITVKDYEGSISFELSGVKGEAKLIDPMDGSIYEISPEVMEAENGIYKFKNMIIRDYPLIIAFE